MWMADDMWLVLWQLLITKTNNTTLTSKSLSRISSGDYKRTWQEVADVLLSYLYMVYTSNKQSYPNVHILAMSILYVHHKVNIL